MTRNRIEGYHGTTKANAMDILSQNHFRNSTKNNEWLGTGVYFFAYAGHAKWWCSHARFANCETVILQAILEYRQEQLLDLDDPSTLEKVNLFVKTALEHADELGLSLGLVEFSSFPKEKRWNFTCNLVRKLMPEIGMITKTFFPNHSTPEPTRFPCAQRQICVSDHGIIMSVSEYKEVSCDESGFGLIPPEIYEFT